MSKKRKRLLPMLLMVILPFVYSSVYADDEAKVYDAGEVQITAQNVELSPNNLLCYLQKYS